MNIYILLKDKIRFSTVMITILLMFSVVFFLAPLPKVQAQTPGDAADIACQGIGGCDENAESGINTTIKSVINMLLMAVGIMAVIVLIIGAIRYVVSGGDQQAVSGAKNMIIYAIVGLIIAIMAFAIVNLVISRTTTVTRADNLEVTSRARV